MTFLKNIASWFITALITISVVILVVTPLSWATGEFENGYTTYYGITILFVGYMTYSSVVGVPFYAFLWHRKLVIWKVWIIPLGFIMGLIPMPAFNLILCLKDTSEMKFDVQLTLIGGLFGLLTGITSWLRRKPWKKT